MKLTDRFFSQAAVLKERQDAGLHVINELQRFRLLVTCLFCSMGVSLVYTFELFTTEFSHRYQLSAGDLSTISTVGVAFCYFVVPYAVIFEFMGPTPLLLWGCVCGFIGCLGLNLIFLDIIPGNLVVICVFYAFMNTCAGMFDATSIVTLVETFPRNRGLVVALAKVMTGLGSSVLSSISTNLFGTNISGYMFFMMAFAMTVSLVGAVLLELPPYVVNWWRRRGRSAEEIADLESLITVYYAKGVPGRRLAVGYIVAISLVVFVAITAPVVAYVNVTQNARYVIGSLTVVIVLCFFIMLLPIRWLGGVDEPSPSMLTQGLANNEDDAGENGTAPDERGGAEDMDREGIAPLSTAARNNRTAPEDEDEDSDDLELPQKKAQVDAAAAARSASARKSVSVEPAIEVASSGGEDTATVTDRFTEYVNEVEERYNDPVYPGDIWDALKKPDVYLILLGFILQGAIGVMVMYNAGTIYVATSGEPRSVGVSALYTAFLGVGSALGRIAVGVYEAYVQSQPAERRRFLVTMALPIPPLLGILGGILILVLPGEALLFPFIVIYFKEGAFYSTCAIVFPALYATHHAIYYNLSSATTVVCVVCFNRFLFGFLVDQKHDSMGFGRGEDCTGRECVRIPLIVATILSAVAAVTLGIVHFRYRRHVLRTTRDREADAASQGSEFRDVDALE